MHASGFQPPARGTERRRVLGESLLHTASWTVRGVVWKRTDNNRITGSWWAHRLWGSSHGVPEAATLPLEASQSGSGVSASTPTREFPTASASHNRRIHVNKMGDDGERLLARGRRAAARDALPRGGGVV
jgi:hypothetical protein